MNQVALVFDARGGSYFEELGQALDYLRASGIAFRCSTSRPTTRRWWLATRPARRPHPLSRNLLEGIERERRLLAPLRAQADMVIDTTDLSPWELRRHLEETLLADGLSDQLFVSLESFGYRYGLPGRGRHGAGRAVLAQSSLGAGAAPAVGSRPGREGVRGRHDPKPQAFLDRVVDLVRFLAPGFLAEQKRRLVLALGCTGGRHRSVALTRGVGPGAWKRTRPWW